MRLLKLLVATCASALFSCAAMAASGSGGIVYADPDQHFHPKGKPPSEHTLKIIREARERMPFDDTASFAVVEVLSRTGSLTECAAGFFAALRRLDAADLDAIIALPFPEHGLGVALNDRLRRAAHR